MAEPEVVLLITTLADRHQAEGIGETLVEKRLAACGSVIPMVHSFFRSGGSLRREHEALLMVKTTKSASAAAQAEIRQRHSYENPEILEVPVSGGSAQYLSWLAGEVRAP